MCRKKSKNCHMQLRLNYDRVVREGETAERRLQMELKEENDALRLQRESEWVSVLIVGKLK